MIPTDSNIPHLPNSEGTQNLDLVKTNRHKLSRPIIKPLANEPPLTLSIKLDYPLFKLKPNGDPSFSNKPEETKEGMVLQDSKQEIWVTRRQIGLGMPKIRKSDLMHQKRYEELVRAADPEAKLPFCSGESPYAGFARQNPQLLVTNQYQERLFFTLGHVHFTDGPEMHGKSFRVLVFDKFKAHRLLCTRRRPFSLRIMESFEAHDILIIKFRHNRRFNAMFSFFKAHGIRVLHQYEYSQEVKRVFQDFQSMAAELKNQRKLAENSPEESPIQKHPMSISRYFRGSSDSPGSLLSGCNLKPSNMPLTRAEITKFDEDEEIDPLFVCQKKRKTSIKAMVCEYFKSNKYNKGCDYAKLWPKVNPRTLYNYISLYKRFTKSD